MRSARRVEELKLGFGFALAASRGGPTNEFAMHIHPFHAANEAAVIALREACGRVRALQAGAGRILRAAGCPKISLLVREGIAGALACYWRMGFAPDEGVSLGRRWENDAG